MSKKIISMLLVCLMVCSSVPLIFGNYASAATGAANFLPNTFVTGLDTWNESSISMGTQQQISSLLSSRYPSRVITDVNTTIYTFNSKLSFVQSSYDKVVVFSKGHRGVPAPGHVSLVDYGGLISNQITDYNEIFPKTSSKNTVTFIWHCQTAYPYNPGGVNFDSSYRACGMPFSWTHNNNMGYYGTSGDQVYLGWNERDPLKIYDFSLGDTKNVTVMGGTVVHSPQYEWYTNPTYNRP